MTEPRTWFGKRFVMYGTLATAATAIMTFGVMIGADQYAPATRGHVHSVEMLVSGNSLSILLIQRDGLQREIWALEDRIESTGGNADARARLREMRLQLDRLNAQIKKQGG